MSAAVHSLPPSSKTSGADDRPTPRVVAPAPAPRSASPPFPPKATNGKSATDDAHSPSPKSSSSSHPRSPDDGKDKKELPEAKAAPAEEEEEELDPNAIPVFINMETLQQILELDDEDDDEFSKGMVEAYFTQAEDTFDKMDAAFAKKELKNLSALGHFLKGSSAALGVMKVQASCESIQHYGDLRDEVVGADLTQEDALVRIGKLLAQVKREHAQAKAWLKKRFDL